MADEQTGYVQLRDFAENTDRDLSRALTDLSNQGMRRLLLDLRNNPGGPLDQAIRVSNRFLPKGDLIVYTKGRMPNSDMSYRATEESEYTRLPVVVLTNRNSASASEIVSGALQDHDRALIVGETTFGKALVQSVMRLREGAGLALTTARYYTPSGRLIQRPWDGTFDEYLTYSLRGQSSERTHDAKDLKLTDAGRKVYSGGGIEPDRHLEGPIEGFNPTKFGRSLYARQLFATFAQRFWAEGDTRQQPSGKDRQVVGPDFVVDDAMLGGVPQAGDILRREDGRAGVCDRPALHQGDDPLRHRPVALRRGNGAPAPHGSRPAGTVCDGALRRGAAAHGNGPFEGHESRRSVGAGAGQITERPADEPLSLG